MASEPPLKKRRKLSSSHTSSEDQTPSTKSNPKAFPFFELPRELRDQIYDDALVEEYQEVSDYKKGGHYYGIRFGVERSPALNLLLISRHFNREYSERAQDQVVAAISKDPQEYLCPIRYKYAQIPRALTKCHHLRIGNHLRISPDRFRDLSTLSKAVEGMKSVIRQFDSLRSASLSLTLEHDGIYSTAYTGKNLKNIVSIPYVTRLELQHGWYDAQSPTQASQDLEPSAAWERQKGWKVRGISGILESVGAEKLGINEDK